LLGSALSAQEAERWYYGWNPDSGEVFAYTAEGEVNSLLSDVGEIEYIRRVNDENALGLLLAGDAEQLYLLTPEEARSLTATFDTSDFDFAPLLIGGDYALFTSSYSFGASTGMLADFSAGTLSPLGDFDMHRGVRQAAFSEDGALLRFIRVDEGEPDQWSLVERTLATGEDRVIYSGEGFPNLIADDYGDHWLVSENVSEGDNPRRAYVLVSASGESETAAESSRDNPVAGNLLEGYVLSYSADCSGGCEVTMQPIEGGAERTLAAPGFFNPVAVVGDGQLLVVDLETDAFYLLSEGEQPQEIGGYDPRIVSQPFSELLSPDERFLLVLTEEGDVEGYSVWDFEQEQFAFHSPIEQYPFILVYYDEGGFIVTEGVVTFDLYRTADGSAFPLPEEAGRCLVVLDDGDVLCTITGDSEHDRGIYRYDADEDTYVLLVEGAIMR
jgi:hypothetical protein